MGAAGTALAARATADGPSGARPSRSRQRHPVGAAYGRAVAGSAGAVRPLVHVLEPLPPLAGRWRLGPGPGWAEARRRRPGRTGLGGALRRFQQRPGAPARRRGQRGGDQALGRSRGGWGTKLHLRVDRAGKPLNWVLTGGERNEQPALDALLRAGPVRRSGRGRPRHRPGCLVGDRAYSSGKTRRYLRGRGIRCGIPRRRDEPPARSFDRQLYRERNVVERAINRFKRFRRIATRYEKTAAHYHAFLTLAAILDWL